jgi:hypothetical protein
VPAEVEPLNLTEICGSGQRTLDRRGITSWLEDVDLLTVHRKRYAFESAVADVRAALWPAGTADR